jgi:hypothetical protein
VLELADIIRVAGPAYREAHGARLLPSHRRTLDDLVTCRTAARGGCCLSRYSADGFSRSFLTA